MSGFARPFGFVPEESGFVPEEFGACPVSGLADSDDVALPELGPESVSAPATVASASIAADTPAVIKPAPNHTDNRSTLAPIHDYVFSESGNIIVGSPSFVPGTGKWPPI